MPAACLYHPCRNVCTCVFRLCLSPRLEPPVPDETKIRFGFSLTSERMHMSMSVSMCMAMHMDMHMCMLMCVYMYMYGCNG